MAQHLSTSDITALPIRDYASDVRSRLRSGDLLFCSGNYLVSKMIQEVTSSPWSHVGIIIVAESINRVLLLESVEDVGVRFAPLSKYLTDYENGKPYDGPLVVARSSAITPVDTANVAAVKAIAAFGADALTLPYDKDEVGELLARVTLGIGKKNESHAYICSELVAACFATAGITIVASDGGFVTPENVWRDNSIALIARLQ